MLASGSGSFFDPTEGKGIKTALLLMYLGIGKKFQLLVVFRISFYRVRPMFLLDEPV